MKAVKENRMICSIGSVSSSGMSRTMKFVELKQYGKDHHVNNFHSLFDVLGHDKIKDSDYFRIKRCDMDMVFATNYNIIKEFKFLGFITESECKVLEQRTPHLI